MKKLFTLAVIAVIAIFVSCSDDNETNDPRSFAITVTSGGNGTASANVPTAVPGNTVTLTATPDKGYAFASWFVESGDATLSGLTENPATFTMPATDVKVVASFNEIGAEIHTITVTAQEGGEISYDPKEAAAGTIVKIAAEPKKGYRFTGWKVEKGGVEIRETENPLQAGFEMGDEDVVIVAQFAIAIYAITVDGNIKDGKVEVKDGVESALEGTLITLTATPDEGFKFVGWELDGYELSEDGRTNNPITIKMPANDLGVGARFVKPMEDVLAVIEDPTFKAYAEYRMSHEQTVVVKSEYLNIFRDSQGKITGYDFTVETEEIKEPRWDMNNDGKLSEEEAAAIRAIDISKKTLEGLDGFNWDGTAVQSLDCKGYLPGLEVLKASGQKIVNLNANEFRALRVLVCDNNGLRTLDIVKCSKLTMLFVEENELTVLDITKNRALHTLSCHTNKIVEINIGAMAFRKDNTYVLQIGCQDLGINPDDGKEISLLVRGMRANQVNYWNSALAEDALPYRQYNRRIGVIY